MKVSRNFKRSEFACQCGCGFAAVDIELVAALEDVRQAFGGKKPVIINSACRCAAHNEEIGGAPESKHVKAMAADFWVKYVRDQDLVADYLEQKYPDRYGIGRYDGRTHIDVRDTKARWDERSAKK